MDRFFFKTRHWIKEETALLALICLTAASVGISEWARSDRFHGHVREFTHSGGQAPPRPLPIPVPLYFRVWRERFLATSRPHDSLGLVRGIFLGDDSEVPTLVRNRFRNAGLSHLLAASGFNCWIVAVVFAGLARFGLGLAGPLLPTRVFLRARRYSKPIARLCGAWLFWLWTDQSPPITRSVALISTQFLLELLDLSTPFPRLLFVQYVVSILVVPSLWRSASFQLTFGCLFGIQFVPPILDRLTAQLLPERVSARLLKNSIWDYFKVSFGACVGCMPTTWLVFQEINFTSLLTNWFAVPPVSFLLMPMGLAEILLLAPLSWLERWHWVGVMATALAIGAGWVAHVLHLALVFFLAHAPSLRFTY